MAHACEGPIQVHHIEARSMGGSRRKDLLKATLCSWAHAYVESHREEAKAIGLLVRRT